MRMARPDDLFRSYHLRDVSLGGMFVKTDQPRPMGTDVDVKVEFVRGGAFEARGKVVRVVRARDLPDRSQPTGIGIEFTQMTEDSRHLLEELLEDPTSTIEPPDPRTEP
jgi:uncharacterized protein (TIGR02266 family)